MKGGVYSLIPVPPNTSAPACPEDGAGPVAALDRQFAQQQLPVIVLLVLVCITGTVGNLLVIIAGSNRRKKSSATVYILALAGVDLLTCAVTIPMRVFSYRHVSFSAPGWCEMESCVTVGSLLCSLLLLIAIAEDRLRAVRRPMDFFMSGTRRSVLVSVSVLACGFLLSVPFLLTVHEGTFLLQEENCTVTACFSISTNNHTWSIVSFAITAVPFFSSGFIIAVIYAMVYKRVYDSRAAAVGEGRARESLQTKTETLQLEGRLQQGKTERLQQETGCCSGVSPGPRPARRPAGQRVVILHHFRLAKMLLLVTTVFLVTWLSHVILTIYVMTMSSKAYHTLGDVELGVSNFFQHLYFLNSALNPIIYTIAYRSFRDRLRALFGRMAFSWDICGMNGNDIVR